jgi:hypothetical protein
MEAEDRANPVEELKRFVQREVAAGFLTSGEIVQSAVEMFADDLDEDRSRPVAERYTREAVATHLQSQANWPPVTDCDRLDDAFAELESRGIVSRQNFSCCGNCGVAEIGDEMQSGRAAGRPVRGYTFFHMQDTESATEGYGLFLNYGSVEKGDAATVGIGREIVAVLQRHGLETDWDGNGSRRIQVSLDWKRRRPYEVVV